jgi:hypothetical protein
MLLDAGAEPPMAANPFRAADVVAILHEHGWLEAQPSPEQRSWCEHAASLLGPHAADRPALEALLIPVFCYDARTVLGHVESHVVLARYGARDVIRHLALLILEGGPLDSDRFKEVVAALKECLELRGRELFHPIRLALAGRAGEGALDRVILLLDAAVPLAFATRVKSTRDRILEFCAALD